jgi:hypothetical protein
MRTQKDGILLELTREEAWEEFYSLSYTPVRRIGPVTTKYKVSICTTCMDRAADIKKTYMENLQNNERYSNVEFVLLNYGSKDDLDAWAYQNLGDYIQRGILNYYRTDEPRFYSMTHSRNIAFKLASGDIVNNVDADHFTNPGFAGWINALANQFNDKKTVFVKSAQTNRGRLGLFKSEFVELGGYDEGIAGYGYDDTDLLMRAHHSGLRVVKFGGQYMRLTQDHERHPGNNYQVKDWKYTQRRNALISLLNVYCKRFKANEGHHWGRATLIKNLCAEVRV